MAIMRELRVICVHGEGDRATVMTLRRNALLAARPQADEAEIAALGDEAEVLVVLRDETHHTRIEWPVTDWAEVEEWKALAGYDGERRQWKSGAIVKVSLVG